MLDWYDFYTVSQLTAWEDLKFMQSGECFRSKQVKRYDTT